MDNKDIDPIVATTAELIIEGDVHAARRACAHKRGPWSLAEKRIIRQACGECTRRYDLATKISWKSFVR